MYYMCCLHNYSLVNDHRLSKWWNRGDSFWLNSTKFLQKPVEFDLPQNAPIHTDLTLNVMSQDKRGSILIENYLVLYIICISTCIVFIYAKVLSLNTCTDGGLHFCWLVMLITCIYHPQVYKAAYSKSLVNVI